MSDHTDEPREPAQPAEPPAPLEPGVEHTGNDPEPGIEHVGDELDGVDESLTAGAVFDIEAFVRALPEGVALCPTCLGMGGVVEEPPFDPTKHACATCEGRGRVRTGSLKANEAEVDCSACQGRGWMPNEPHELPAGPARALEFEAATPTDYLGRTPDHPEFDWSRVTRAIEPVAPPEPEPVA